MSYRRGYRSNHKKASAVRTREMGETSIVSRFLDAEEKIRQRREARIAERKKVTLPKFKCMEGECE